MGTFPHLCRWGHCDFEGPPNTSSGGMYPHYLPACRGQTSGLRLLYFKGTCQAALETFHLLCTVILLSFLFQQDWEVILRGFPRGTLAPDFSSHWWSSWALAHMPCTCRPARVRVCRVGACAGCYRCVYVCVCQLCYRVCECTCAG